jgi:hypothetical protein
MWQTIAVVLWCTLGLPAFSQQILVNRQNKTIAITAEESVSVDPEVATITVGYQNYGPSKDAAYGENIRVSNEVTKALLNSGVPKSALETESLRLERAEEAIPSYSDVDNPRYCRPSAGCGGYGASGGCQRIGSLGLERLRPESASSESGRCRFGKSQNDCRADGQGVKCETRRARVCKQSGANRGFIGKGGDYARAPTSTSAPAGALPQESEI